MSVVEPLLRRYPIISDQIEADELRVILMECEAALNRASGDIVEFGCYVGTASLFLARMLRELAPERRLYVYDSFDGLPEKTDKDSSPAGMQFMAGELCASKSELVRNFKRAGLPLPIIHKGWFGDVTPDKMPSSIAFAFLDGDYYASVMDSLELVWPCLENGAVVVVDDYTNMALPGARRAVDEWCLTHPARLNSIASLAVLSPEK